MRVLRSSSTQQHKDDGSKLMAGHEMAPTVSVFSYISDSVKIVERFTVLERKAL